MKYVEMVETGSAFRGVVRRFLAEVPDSWEIQDDLPDDELSVMADNLGIQWWDGEHDDELYPESLIAEKKWIEVDGFHSSGDKLPDLPIIQLPEAIDEVNRQLQENAEVQP